MWRKIYSFSKRKQKEIMFVNFISKIEKVLNKESCCGVGVMMCYSLNYYQHFLWQMTRLLKHEFWNKSFEEKTTHTLYIPRRLHWRGDYNRAKICDASRKGCLQNYLVQNHGDFKVNLHELQAWKQKRV